LKSTIGAEIAKGVCIWIVGGKFGWVSLGEQVYRFCALEIQWRPASHHVLGINPPDLGTKPAYKTEAHTCWSSARHGRRGRLFLNDNPTASPGSVTGSVFRPRYA